MRGGRGGQFIPSATPRHRLIESYRLDAGEAAGLSELWAELRNDRVTGRKQLATAMRRFGIAGETWRAEDQMID